jgi:hypothetical protein
VGSGAPCILPSFGTQKFPRQKHFPLHLTLAGELVHDTRWTSGAKQLIIAFALKLSMTKYL